jgi:uncharacterized short protein YbdD (DUF466 family)
MRDARTISHAEKVALRIWRGVREWCGDAAYERYVTSHAKHHCGASPLSREEFYLQQLHKKYSRVSRCC